MVAFEKQTWYCESGHMFYPAGTESKRMALIEAITGV